MTDLIPINNCVVVALTNEYDNVTVPGKKYDTKTSGIVVTVSDPKTQEKLINHKVYFDAYDDNVQQEEDGQKYAFVAFDKIRGYRA